MAGKKTKINLDKEVRMLIATVAEIKPAPRRLKGWEITTRGGNVIYSQESNMNKEIKAGKEYELAWFENSDKTKQLYSSWESLITNQGINADAREREREREQNQRFCSNLRKSNQLDKSNQKGKEQPESEEENNWEQLSPYIWWKRTEGRGFLYSNRLREPSWGEYASL